jgi:DNA polymerase-3 subunit delta'
VPFRAITGHGHVLTLLARAIARDSMPPAVLMAGPAGVGKRMTAIAVAQAINCLAPLSAPGLEREACGECTSCRRIARGIHPDVIVVEPGDSGSIKIEQIRTVIDQSQYRPFEARRRVVIVDEADAAGSDAQSALLKTLEEPPSASFFILVSSRPDSLLPTVLSRCPRLRFGPLSPADVARVLIRDHEYSETDAHAAAADADGSVGRALEAASEDISDAREAAQRVLQDTARVADPVRRIGIARALTEGKGSPAEERNRLAVRLRSMGSLLRDITIIASHADRSTLANADLETQLEKLAASYDTDRSLRAYAAVDQALGAIERNASPKVVADWLLLEL